MSDYTKHALYQKNEDSTGASLSVAAESESCKLQPVFSSVALPRLTSTETTNTPGVGLTSTVSEAPRPELSARSRSSSLIPPKVLQKKQVNNNHDDRTSFIFAYHKNLYTDAGNNEEFCSATVTNVNVPSSQEDALHCKEKVNISSTESAEEIVKNKTRSYGSFINASPIIDQVFSEQPFLRGRISNEHNRGKSGLKLVPDFSRALALTCCCEACRIPCNKESQPVLENGYTNHTIIRLIDFKKWLLVDLVHQLTRNKFYLWKSYSVLADDNNNNEERTGSSIINTPKSSQVSLAVAANTGRKLQSTTPLISPLVQVTSSAEVTVELNSFPDNTLKMKEERQLEFILKSLVAGGVAGMCAKTSVAPLDRIKILLQAHSKHYSHLGVFSGLRGIVKKEKFIALYKGNGAQMVRIFPYAATQFTSFEMYKKFLGEDSHVARFAAGSAAGVTAVALTYPLDTIRARLAFQVTGEHIYSGIYSCAVQIFREEGGIRALYRGFIPTVCGMIPYAGLSFYCFESFKYICMKYMPTYTCKSHSTNTGGLVLLLYAKLLCGGVAGAVAQTVAYPLDVTRRRMQLAMMDEKTKKFGMGMVSTLKLIYQENGVMRGLYRGMSINYLRAIPMVAVSFSTYEVVKQALNLDTGLAIKTG